MGRTQNCRGSEGSRTDQAGEPASADHRRAEKDRGIEVAPAQVIVATALCRREKTTSTRRGGYSSPFIDAVFSRTDEQEAQQQDRHLQRGQTAGKTVSAPNGDQMNQRYC